MSKRTNPNENPVTTDIPMLRDKQIYKVYIVSNENKYSINEIKAVAEVCNINFVQARHALCESKISVAEGNAYRIRDVLEILLKYNIDYEIKPSYPYALNNLD